MKKSKLFALVLVFALSLSCFTGILHAAGDTENLRDGITCDCGGEIYPSGNEQVEVIGTQSVPCSLTGCAHTKTQYRYTQRYKCTRCYFSYSDSYMEWVDNGHGF